MRRMLSNILRHGMFSPTVTETEKPPVERGFSDGRDGQIRTDDILLPKQALYQAELRPVTGRETYPTPAPTQALS